MTQVRTPKKLIEVALPLDAINVASAKEKSIRHGHPSTLHLWWARRPLAAARAVLFSQMVNDPGGERGYFAGMTKAQAAVKREELFEIIEQLVLWENTNNEKLLERARALIIESWQETCRLNRGHPQAAELFDPSKLPAFHDPFAGGGALPLEAQRLGLESHASDLNPVAVLINKAMIEIPPKFANLEPIGPALPSDRQRKFHEDWTGAKGLAEDVRRYASWMRSEAERRVGAMYPKVKITAEVVKDALNPRPDLLPYVDQELTVIAWLWARTVKSPNPAFNHVDVPLASTFLLSSKEGQEAYVEPVIDGDTYRFTVRVGMPTAGALDGTKLARGANFRCLLSNSPIEPQHIYAEANAGRMGARLMAMVAEGSRGRVYLAATAEHEVAAKQASPEWKPDVAMPDNPRWFSPPLYGLKNYADLFTPRQLVSLTTFTDLVAEAIAKARSDAVNGGRLDDGVGLDGNGSQATAYAEAIGLFLAFAVSKATDRNSSLCFWEPPMNRLRGTFGRQALPMVWDYAETHPLAGAGGDIFGTAMSLCEVLDNFSAVGVGNVSQADAQNQKISWNKVVSTDPPYYDNIGYADLSDFFYVWLRRSLRPLFPGLFATVAVPKAEELVATPYRHGGKLAAETFFLDGMCKAMHNLAEQAHPAFPVTIYYAFKQAETKSSIGTHSTGWETFLEAVIRSGFAITGTWPMRTELTVAIKKGSNVLASSIILVCRKRSIEAASVSRREFIRELNAALPDALDEMTRGGVNSPVAPVDLSQAIIGPGMAIFSKYASVLEADGTPMSVKTALQLINRFLAEDDFEADTQFCLHWFETTGWAAGKYGEADVLARAKGTSVGGLSEAGVLESKSGQVRLLRWREYPSDWSPEHDLRAAIWEMLHHLIRASSSAGEAAAGALLARMMGKAEPIRSLAYRLFTLCERKGWAEDARSYNDLITSWQGIEVAANEAGPRGTQITIDI